MWLWCGGDPHGRRIPAGKSIPIFHFLIFFTGMGSFTFLITQPRAVEVVLGHWHTVHVRNHAVLVLRTPSDAQSPTSELRAQTNVHTRPPRCPGTKEEVLGLPTAHYRANW